MKYIVYLLMLVSISCFASDPFTSVFKQTTKDSSAYKLKFEGDNADSSKWKFFQFGDTDSLLGSLSVAKAGDSQSVKFNAINYYLWFGGNKKLPFQLYISDEVEDSNDQNSNKDSNTLQLLDPETGVAIKFPLLWTYQSSGDGFCAFMNGSNTIGHCSLGGDVTLSFKDLKDINNDAETAFGQTVRLGGAVLFPVLSADDGTEQGYLSLAAKVVYSHTNIDDSTQLFTPVLDVNGSPIPFDNNILSSDLEIKWAFDKRLAITAKWIKPYDNKDYIDDLFKLTLETQF